MLGPNSGVEFLARILSTIKCPSWWVFRIILIFSARGWGRASPRRREGGRVDFVLQIPAGGGLSAGKGPRGREGVCGELGIFLGGGFFFFGAEMSTTPLKFTLKEFNAQIGHGEVWVYSGTGVPCGVRRATWERSLKNWELQIPCFEEFCWRENTLGLVPACLPHTLGYACTFYAPTSPPPIKAHIKKIQPKRFGDPWEAGRHPAGQTGIHFSQTDSIQIL